MFEPGTWTVSKRSATGRTADGPFGPEMWPLKQRPSANRNGRGQRFFFGTS